MEQLITTSDIVLGVLAAAIAFGSLYGVRKLTVPVPDETTDRTLASASTAIRSKVKNT